MAVLAQQTASLAGTAITYAAADVAGDSFPANDRAELRVKNGSGASINVTIATPGTTEFGQAQPDIVMAVAAGAEKAWAPREHASRLADPSDGRIHVAYSSVTTVTVAYVGI